MQRRTTIRSWVLAIVITAVFCALAFGLANLFHGRVSKGFASVKAIDSDEIIQIQCVSDGVIYYNGSSLNKISSGGRRAWSSLIGYDGGFNASEAGIAAWEGQNFVVIDPESGETRYSNRFDHPIRSAKVGQIYCAVQIGAETNSTIRIMTESSRDVDSLTLTDKTVVDYGFFYDGTLFWVMALDANGTAPSCTITVLRPGKRVVGNVTDPEQLLYRPIFEQSEIIVGGDTFLKTFSYAGEEQTERRKLLYGYTIADVCEDGASPTVVTVPTEQFSDTAALQDLRVLKGDLDVRLRMPFDCRKVVAEERRVYGFSPQGYLMIADIDTRKVNTYNLGISFTDVAGITKDGYGVLYDDAHIYLVSVH